MRKVLNTIKYVLLRLFPLLYLIFFLFCIVRDGNQEFNRFDNLNFGLHLDSFAFALCFIFLGIASMLRVFNATIKLSDVCKSQNLQDNDDALVHLSYKRLNP